MTTSFDSIVDVVRTLVEDRTVVTSIGEIDGNDVESAEAAVRELARAGDIVLFAPASSETRWAAWWDDLFLRCGLQPLDIIRPVVWHDDTVPAIAREAAVLYVRPDVAGTIDERAAERSALHPLTLVRAMGSLGAVERRNAELELLADELTTRWRHARLDAVDQRIASRHQAPSRAAAAADVEPLISRLDARAEVAARAAEQAAASAARRAPANATISADLVVRARSPWSAMARWASARRVHAPLFDEGWYVRQCPDVLAGRLSPYHHYRKYGVRQGFLAHPLFDSSWYRSRVPCGLAADDDPVEHYLDEGANLGLDPHPVFRTSWYAERHRLPAGINPLVDYLARWRVGASPHPLFDAPWYLRQNPEVADSGVEPLEHFLVRGWAEGRDPRPSFDVRWYLFHSADVAAEGTNPLVHYLVHGWRQGRDPHRLFEVRWYLRRHPDVAAAGVEPLGFYLEHGAARGDDPGGIFETSWYRARHPEADTPLEHYIEHGIAAGEAPSRWAVALHAGLPFLAG